MNRICLYVLIAICQGMLLSAQPLINGHLSDLVDEQEIIQAKIEIPELSISTYSNAFGDFLIKPKNYEPTPLNTYRFYQNALIWEGELDITLEMFSIDGKRVYLKRNLGNQGHLLLPQLEQGIYLLRIHTLLDEKTYKAFSDGQKTFAVDRKADPHIPEGREGSLTLKVTKEGYYPREILLPRRDTILELKMLKGQYSELNYFNELIDPISFELISSLPSRTHAGGVKSVKIIFNERDGLMYYMNTKAYKYHYTFAKDFLDFNQGNNVFNLTQYREGPDRYLYPANLNYYQGLDKYVLHLVAANEMSCENLKRLYDKIIETSFLKDKLFLFANKVEWESCEGIPKISSQELFEGQNYQGLNLAENYGYLRKVDIVELENTYLGRRDIVLLNGIPNDVSVVAGIITTEFQTPLSHINVLSHNRGTPNMALKDAWDHPLFNEWLGELVYLKVRADSFEMRKAGLQEATVFWNQREPQSPVILQKNTELSGLVDLSTANHTFVDRIGGKAANFAEILKVNADGKPIPVPESSFAIPFYYYQRHIEQAGLDIFIDHMLKESRFESDPAYRQAKLAELRVRIEDYPLAADLVELVRNRINNFGDFEAIRFRSSTNAEDLESFSGAGLYNSYSAKKDHKSKTIENAIRKVWASLWNWRAFEERSYFKINHQSCAMGILVHRSFPDEDANGVVITRNLYNENPGFIINVQFKEYSIVFPEPGILHDQIMMLAWSNIPGQDFMIEYLTFSNIPELNGQRVMTDQELIELGEYCMALKLHFFQNVAHNCKCDFNDFALDIEFKVDSQVSPRKIYIKQARLYE